MNIFDFKGRNKLDNPERRKVFPPTETLARLGLLSGMDLADVGSGIGYFALPAAKMVGQASKVYALDLSADMLEIIDDKIIDEDIKNIETIKTEGYDLVLDDGSVDLVLLVNVLHEVEDRSLFIEELKRISRRDGSLALIDFKEKKFGKEGPPEEIRIGSEQARSLLEGMGYRIEEVLDFNESFYGIRASLG